MTVCWSLPLPGRTYTIEYDRTADWCVQWLIVLTRQAPTVQRSVTRRYATYTEARRALARLKPTHREEIPA